jgi:hypothetical protein
MAKNKPTVLFGVVDGGCDDHELLGCHSPVFEVTNKPIVVRGWNFGPGLNGNGEKIVLEMVAGANDGEHFEAVNTGCGCCVTLSECNNEIVIAKSGRYRLNRCVCDTEDPPTNNDIHVEWQTLDTDVQVTIGDSGMACKCEDGNRVSVVRNADGSTTITVDNVSTLIPAGSQVSAITAPGGAVLLTIDGVTTTIPAPLTLAQVLAAATVELRDAFGVHLGQIFP